MTTDPTRFLPPPAAANPIPRDPSQPNFAVGDSVALDADDGITGTITQVFDNGWVTVAWAEALIHPDQLIPGGGA